MVQLLNIDLENDCHESFDDGRNLILEAVSAVEESFREDDAVQNG